MAKFSLAWDAHNHNISEGLTALQQNGEFVDMTLAADGHHVKVHKMVISLASPYLKEIVTSVQSDHPVIFLNKVSYPTLSAILEYIYTGEVLIDKESISELLDAAKELHIRGLEDMKFQLPEQDAITKPMVSKSLQGQPLSEYQYREKARQNENEAEQVLETDYEQDNIYMETMETENDEEITYEYEIIEDAVHEDSNNQPTVDQVPQPHIQYTISNMGALQMILNRCVYCLRYTSVKGASAGHRQWRCADYNKRKCPAGVISKGSVIIKRFGAHNHPFHDKKILKKVRDGAVYSEIQEAEASCKAKSAKDELANKG